MDISTLEWFRTIYEMGSFRLAGNRLGVAPSTLNRYLAHLEQELGCKLLDRSHKKMELTAAGRIFWEYTAQTLSVHRQMYRQLSKQSDEILLRLGAGAKTFRYFSGIYPQLLEKFPSLILESHEGSAKSLLPLLYNQQLDVILAGVNRLTSSHAKIAPLYASEVLLAVPAFHPIARFGGKDPSAVPAITPEQLQSLRGTPFLMHDSQSAMYQVIRDFFKQYLFQPLREFSSPNTAVIETLSGTGQYAFFALKGRQAEPGSDGNCVYFSLPERRYIYTAAIFRKDYEPTGAEREMVRLLCQKTPPGIRGEPFINLVTKSIMQT